MGIICVNFCVRQRHRKTPWETAFVMIVYYSHDGLQHITYCNLRHCWENTFFRQANTSHVYHFNGKINSMFSCMQLDEVDIQHRYHVESRILVENVEQKNQVRTLKLIESKL
jgi:hypothetical protein